MWMVCEEGDNLIYSSPRFLLQQQQQQQDLALSIYTFHLAIVVFTRYGVYNIPSHELHAILNP